MKPARIVLFFVLIAIGFVAGFGYGRWYGPRPGTQQAAEPKKAVGYHCPMHPAVRSDRPGDCPICGMKLVPDDDQDYPLEGEPMPSGEHAGGQAPDPGAMPMGTVRISTEKQQLIGVKLGTVETAAGTHSIRALGTVMMDETRVAKVQPRIEGWVDKVFVDFTGKLVEKGQPLLTVYSPEMLASQQEYLLALRNRDLLRSSPLQGTAGQAESLIAAARKRLELWDLSGEQIDEISRTGKPLTNITLYAPIGGYVMMRNAFPKQRITPETELYTLADLSTVWIMADVFESDAPQIRLGMAAAVNLSYTGRRLSGRVSYIQPQVDPTTRTLKIRIEAANPSLALKPDMFVEVDFHATLAARLVVPAEAVLDSGLKKTVFVDRGNGYFEPRRVETGERRGGVVEIVSGLKAGERIVISGNFLIDSESQLKAAAAGMAGHQHD